MSVIIYFFCFLLCKFCFFGQPSSANSRLSADLHQIWHDCLIVCNLYWGERFLKSSKTRSRRQKKSNIGSFLFIPASRRFCSLWRNGLWFLTYLFAIPSRLLYLSENIFLSVQDRLVFSITWFNEASKRPTLTVIISRSHNCACFRPNHPNPNQN